MSQYHTKVAFHSYYLVTIVILASLLFSCGEMPEELSKSAKSSEFSSFAISQQDQAINLCDCIGDQCKLQWYDGGDINSSNQTIKEKSLKVQQLQQLLIKRGYFDKNDASYGNFIEGEINRAFFSDFTQLMLSSYQSWNRLSRINGVLDQETVDSLCEPFEKTKSGKSIYKNGVNLARYTQQQKVEYFVEVFKKYDSDSNQFWNSLPYGVNFIQIRGFADYAAVENVPNKFNDILLVIINDNKKEPAQIEEITASADYGNIIYYASTIFGYLDNPMKAEIVGPEWISTDKGFPITQSGRIMKPYYGRHINGSGIERGMGLIDAWDDDSGDFGVHAVVDWNHNGQIDNAETKYKIYGIDEGVGNNFHYGSLTSEGVHNLSAGCHTIPRDGAYQKLTKIIIESGQVQSYVYKRKQYYMNEKHYDEITAQEYAILETVGNRQSVEAGKTEHRITYSDNNTIIRDNNEHDRFRVQYIEGNENSIFMGPQQIEDFSFTSLERSNIRFSLLVLDSRDLPPPTPLPETTTDEESEKDYYFRSGSGRRMR